MRNSTLLKWAQNNNKQNDKTGNRNWIHPPDALQKGHIAYLVKFLGNTVVDQPKGIDVVKEGIRKLQFSQQLRKAEGSKMPKVELTISIDGVSIQEPKSKRILHQYPLHRISYCADDKGEKRFFSFIAKEGEGQDSADTQHMCFVFVSDKLAEEITLTIGQAFDLAYKRFLETSGKELEVQRRVMVLQQRVKRLENENSVLRQRLSDIINGQDVKEYMAQNNISDMLQVPEMVTSSEDSHIINGNTTNGTHNGGPMLLLNLSTSSSSINTAPPPVPPRTFENRQIHDHDFISEMVSIPVVGTKLEGLLMDELDEDFNPRAFENMPFNPANQPLINNANINGLAASTPPLLAPPPPAARRSMNNCTPRSVGPPTNNSQADPFGMGEFTMEPSQRELENAIGLIDKRILEMKSVTLSIECPHVECPSLMCDERVAIRPDRKACCKVCPSSLPHHLSSPLPHLLGGMAGDAEEREGPTEAEVLAGGGCRYPVGGPYENGHEWHPRLYSHGEVKCVKCRCKDGKVSCDRKRCKRSSCNDECCSAHCEQRNRHNH